MKKPFILIWPVILLLACKQNTEHQNTLSLVEDIGKVVVEEPKPVYKEFGRDSIKLQLQNKIENNVPLIAHVLVPLCDNFYQGIVPTTASLGDGFNLKTNLYWATRHGIKRYFKDHKYWKMLKSEVYGVDSVVMERVTFKRKLNNGAEVYMVADAYRGDCMSSCLDDFFGALAGTNKDTVFVDADTILVGAKADLVAFNGHNGLMDVFIDDTYNVDSVQKDAVVIACSSMYEFNRRLNLLQAYPLVTTTNSLYPGAMVMESILTNWALLKTEEDIRLGAGDAYNDVKKCGLNGARNLFNTGW